MKLIPSYFFATLFIGVLVVYLLAPNPRIVLKNPTPETAGEVTYVDDRGVCYQYQKEKVVCPIDPTLKPVVYE